MGEWGKGIWKGVIDIKYSELGSEIKEVERYVI